MRPGQLTPNAPCSDCHCVRNTSLSSLPFEVANAGGNGCRIAGTRGQPSKRIHQILGTQPRLTFNRNRVVRLLSGHTKKLANKKVLSQGTSMFCPRLLPKHRAIRTNNVTISALGGGGFITKSKKPLLVQLPKQKLFGKHRTPVCLLTGCT